jgi:hypothetical protein
MTERRLTPELVLRFTVDSEPWLSCDDCFARVDKYVHRLLADPDYESPAMSAHLRGCGACAEETATLLELAARDADVDPQSVLPRLGRSCQG